MRHAVWGLSLLVACSGGETQGVRPTAVPTETTPIASARAPSASGLGRVADVPEMACPETRGSAPLAADATITECRVDGDCTTGRNGRCIRLSNHGGHGPSLEATICSYDMCFRDADCGSARDACFCGVRSEGEPGSAHTCASGECATDADCGSGRYCRRGPNGRYCHTPSDRCVEETDCGTGMTCTRGSDGVYDCVAFTAPNG